MAWRRGRALISSTRAWRLVSWSILLGVLIMVMDGDEVGDGRGE